VNIVFAVKQLKIQLNIHSHYVINHVVVMQTSFVAIALAYIRMFLLKVKKSVFHYIIGTFDHLAGCKDF
jgi:hypothetical protein